jgi:hypothetical protein
MKLHIVQLHQLSNDLGFLVGQKIKSSDGFVTVHAIEIVPNEETLRFILKEGQPLGYQLHLWLDTFIIYNPEYSEYLPK